MRDHGKTDTFFVFRCLFRVEHIRIADGGSGNCPKSLIPGYIRKDGMLDWRILRLSSSHR